MATLSVCFGKWHPSKPIMAQYNQCETITTSGSSQESSNSAGEGDNCVEVTAVGGAVWVTLDGTTAVAGAGPLIPDGTTRTFDAPTGMSVKVIDAS